MPASILSEYPIPLSRLSQPLWHWAGFAIAYGLAFFLCHWIAAIWGGSFYFSLFYPAAGVRFALLWHKGPRLLPVIVLSEVSVQLLTGVIDLSSPDVLDHVVGVVRAPIAYGLAITLVHWITRRGGQEIVTPPMPFALAAVLAPIFASLASMAWTLLGPAALHLPSSEPVITTSIAFMVGDLLGVLLIAPPLLSLADYRKGARPLWKRAIPNGWEALVVFACGWVMGLLALQVSVGLMLTPIMLTTAWIGLRCGRVVAWAAIAVTAMIALPHSQGATDIATRLAFHMSLAAVAIAGYLAGSYAEALRMAAQDIARRDRMLYQAERLKTLRAMSVAVIHEVSQPLSTLSIESRHLARLSRDPKASQAEIAETASFVETKVVALSDMVRRLRRFGGRAVDEPSSIAIASLVDDMAAIVKPDAQRAGTRLAIAPIAPDLIVEGQDIELMQALVNLVRNAIAASAGGTVAVTADRVDGQIIISIANHVSATTQPHGGMGVGSLVARAIIEAHRGQLWREDQPDGQILHRLSLPAMEALDA